MQDILSEIFDLIQSDVALQTRVQKNFNSSFQESKVEELETNYGQNQADLKLAFKRISDLQAALEEDLDSDIDLSDRYVSTQWGW